MTIADVTLADASAITIALASLFVSVWVVVRNRRDRRLDLLYQCYDRLHRAHRSGPFATISDHVRMEEDEHGDDPSTEEYLERSRITREAVSRELEFASYLAVAKEIDLHNFFALFKGWLAARSMFWRVPTQEGNARNHPYTVRVILLCESKGLLPIKQNQTVQRMSKDVDRFLSTTRPPAPV